MAHQHCRKRGRPVVAWQAPDGGFLVDDQAAAHERQKGQDATHPSM